MKLNEKILTLRKKKGLSQEDLANLLNISRQAVYKWESGASTPDMENIKSIAKIFNVSFDYLMNDDIEVYDSDAEPIRNIVNRKVFYTGYALRSHQAQIDNGYTEEKKFKNRDDTYYSRRKIATDTLKYFNAKDVFFIQHDATTAFFYDDANKAVGIYYAGRVQFLCPIENLVRFEFGNNNPTVTQGGKSVYGVGIGLSGINSIGVGKIPATNYIPSTEAWAELTYRDEKGLRQLKMPFSVNNAHLLHQKDISPDVLDVMWSANMQILIKNLRSVQFKILSYIDYAQKNILTGQIEVKEIDYSVYTKKNLETAKEYNTYVSELHRQVEKENKMWLTAKYVLVGIAVILGLVLLFNIENIIDGAFNYMI